MASSIKASAQQPYGQHNNLDSFLESVGLTREVLFSYEAVETLVKNPQATGAIAGSLVEGLGNRCSDIDILVLVAGEQQDFDRAQREGFSTSLYFHENRRIDVGMFPIDSVRQAAATLKSEHLDDDNRVLSYGQHVLCHRLRSALPIFNEDLFSDVQENFPFGAFVQYLVQRSIFAIDNLLDDLYGMIDENDFPTCMLRCHQTLQTAYQAYAHSLGSTNPNEKWVLPLLRKSEDARAKQLIDWFPRLFYPDYQRLNADHAAGFEHVKKVIETTNAIVEWIET